MDTLPAKDNMKQLFHPRANLIACTLFTLMVLLVVGSGFSLYLYPRSTYQTQVDVAIPQPIPFSHQHHVEGLGIDCRFCHQSVETSAFAGMPSTETCMKCHSQIWTEAQMLAPVRNSWRNNEPLVWNRVHDLPDFVYFNHAVHVNNGVACQSCHGNVNEMPLLWKSESLHMKWCLDCHSDPHPNIRARNEIFEITHSSAEDIIQTASQIMDEYQLQTEGLMDCSACHR